MAEAGGEPVGGAPSEDKPSAERQAPDNWRDRGAIGRVHT